METLTGRFDGWFSWVLDEAKAGINTVTSYGSGAGRFI